MSPGLGHWTSNSFAAEDHSSCYANKNVGFFKSVTQIRAVRHRDGCLLIWSVLLQSFDESVEGSGKSVS